MKVLNIFTLIIILSIQHKVYTFSTSECYEQDDYKYEKLDCLNGGQCVQITRNSTFTFRKCVCETGFSGRLCEISTNECLDVTCLNGGTCRDLPDSFECLCKWPYTGLICEQIRTCQTDAICKNGAKCKDDVLNGPKCECSSGYTGFDCSIKTNPCLSQPCLFGGVCVPLDNGSDYKCECSSSRLGENCQYENICETKQPCKNNSTCVSRLPSNRHFKHTVDTIDSLYVCECNKKFTGTNCDISVISSECNGSKCKSNDAATTNQQFNTKLSLLNILITSSTTTTTSTTSTTTKTQSLNEEELTGPSTNSLNGTFVLVVNIEPNEFIKRKEEIIKEFENKFGILMLIKKETNGNEMIYPYKSSPTSRVTFTKIYFIIIMYACFIKSPHEMNSDRLCLQNIDGFQVINEIKKSSNLLPNYVSNISYEAYNSNDKPKNEMNTINVPTALIVCLIIALIIGISLSMTVLLRQNAIKKVKAPIWFPPPNDSTPPTKVEYEYAQHQAEPIYEKVSHHKELKLGTSAKWSINKVFDDFTHLFHKPTAKLGEISPSSSTSSNSTEYSTDDLNPPVKMRKLDLSSAMPIQHQPNHPASPEYYPSPPESLPDHSFSHPTHHVLNPINFKGGSFNITPLMMFIMGRSKSKSNKQFQSRSINESEIVDTFITNGADLNAKNGDGETALHLAARCGLYEIVKALLNNGCDLNVYDNCGRNVLHTAVSANEYEIVKLILNHCALQSSYNQDNLNAQDNLVLDDKYDLIDSKTIDDLGDTPLIIAARLNYNSIVKLLIEFQASINATDNEGRSALHWCSKVNNLSGALLLIQSNANVNMQDNDEKTPLSSALNELFTLDVADLLIKFDAFMSAEDDAKYNKMKSIITSLQSNTKLSNVNNINVDQIKKDLISKIKQEPTQYISKQTKTSNVNMMISKESNQATNTKSNRLTGASTKRKLSETMSDKSNKSKKAIIESGQNVNMTMTYTPLTPSPPVNQFQRNSYATNSFMYPNQFYFTPQQQQQQQPIQTVSNDYHYNQQNGMTYYDFNQQQHQQTTTPISSNTNSNSNQTYNLFNSNFNESYAAYF